jgi:DNA-binding MarR family transcriptional regulator
MDDLESDVWLHLIALGELLPAALDAQLQRDAQLTHFEFMVLSVLQLSPQSLATPTSIAQAANSTLPRLSHVLARLETRGLVDRVTGQTDKRSREVRLTPAGRRVVIRATGPHIATARKLALDGFDRSELEQLARLLSRITDRLDPEDRLAHAIRD